jgi:thioredoxin 1
MKSFRRLFCVLLLVLPGAAAAAEEKPFDQRTFDELRGAGKPVVVHVFAVWCGTCKVQSQLLAPMLATDEFKPLTLLKADFDKEQGLLRNLNVDDRSTLIAFKGGKEVARTVADMNKESIAGLLRKAL